MRVALQYSLLIIIFALAGVILALTTAADSSATPLAVNPPSLERQPTEASEGVHAQDNRPSLPRAPSGTMSAREVAHEVRYPTEGIFAPVNERARAAVVNILCTSKERRTTKASTGSGAIIDGRGVILTNAHVVEFLLLDALGSSKSKCVARTGSPAGAAYTVELLYMSETWVKDFAPDPDNESPTGTGEEDFALLLITNGLNGASMPELFPALPIAYASETVVPGKQVLIASYPAFTASAPYIEDTLYAVTDVSYVRKLYTFDTTCLDLFSIDGTIASEEGSSGGAVVTSEGNLVGIAVTSTGEPFTLDRALQVLTIDHISSRLRARTGFTLPEFLDSDMQKWYEKFQEDDLPALARYLSRKY